MTIFMFEAPVGDVHVHRPRDFSAGSEQGRVKAREPECLIGCLPVCRWFTSRVRVGVTQVIKLVVENHDGRLNSVVWKIVPVP
jgi:hypothetical protein